ncbi:Transposable element Tcb1 transposase, partial [Cucumispora dikerogammari]
SKLANIIKNETGINVSRWSVLRSLAIDGFHSRSTAKKPFHSDKNIKDRYSWVSKLIYWPVCKFHNVVFSDERGFKLSGSSGHQRVLREMGKRHSLENIALTRKFGGRSIMIWGCIPYEGVGRIVLVDKTMDSIRYARLLTENLFESASMMGLGSNFIFQQDNANAPAHTAKHTASWFR